MKIGFRSGSMEAKVRSGKYFKTKHNLNRELNVCLNELDALPNLYTLYMLDYRSLHKLHGPRSQQLAINLDSQKQKKEPTRIVFIAVDGDPTLFEDWPNKHKLETVTNIKIIDIVDYH